MKRLLLGLILAIPQTMACNAQVIDTVLNKTSQQPFNFSVAVPDGNYRVTVTLGNKKKAGQTVMRAESRRHYVNEVVTKKGKYTTVSFIVNKHNPVINGKAEAERGGLQELGRLPESFILWFSSCRSTHSDRTRYERDDSIPLWQLDRSGSGG